MILDAIVEVAGKGGGAEVGRGSVVVGVHVVDDKLGADVQEVLGRDDEVAATVGFGFVLAEITSMDAGRDRGLPGVFAKLDEALVDLRVDAAGWEFFASR